MARSVSISIVLAEQPAQQIELELAGGEYVVAVAAGYADNVMPRNSRSLVARLAAGLVESGADIAIASPFARGGRLADSSWLARTAAWWGNGFLSLAAHGELATVIGTVRMYRRDALVRMVTARPDIDLDSEIILEARRQGIRIIEVPVELAHVSEENGLSLRSLLAVNSRFWARVRLGLCYRPALWLALPGLVPGLLPLVIALLLSARATPAQTIFWTVVTLAIQCGSLAIFSWQTSSFVTKRWLRRASW